MATEIFPVLLPDTTLGVEIARLPLPSHNLFQRIIRNPRPESPHARERECTEMLAAVLLNAPTLRGHLFRWMARLSGALPELIDELEFEIGTEEFIGAKRDDLRIEGRRDVDNDGPPDVLWTVEVKVGSSFHASLVQRLDDDREASDDAEVAAEADEELVNQLKNYDDWLCRRTAKHCAGFVLALRDLSEALPPLGLKRRWTCLTWTGLGLEVRSALKSDVLPPPDELLGKHLLGFITANLWRTDEMPDATTRLDFNDIALIRAFAKIGLDSAKKVNRLAASAAPLLSESGVGFGDVRTFEKLYKWRCSSGGDRFLVPGLTNDADPSIEVSIGCDDEWGDYYGVWILMSPSHLKFDAARGVVAGRLKKLHERNPRWKAGSGESEDWIVLALVAPLTDLLAAEDQQQKLTEFVKAALTDLKETGIVNAIVSAFSGSKKDRSPGK